jgi:DNA-binding beta-propeller fold protein YncE
MEVLSGSTFEELMKCKKCLQMYKEPKTLPCHHTFCSTCLQDIVTVINGRETTIDCPQCNQTASVPHGKVSHFQTSLVVESMMEVHKKFEDMEETISTDDCEAVSRTNSHESSITINKEKTTAKILPKFKKAHCSNSLKYPWGIAIANNNKLYVADWGNHCVHVITGHAENGEITSSFGTSNSKQFQFMNPRGIALYKDESILVTSAHCLQQYTLDGELVTTIGSKGCNELQFESPTGLAVHPTTGQILIADANNHRIQVLNEDFSFSHFIGCQGTNIGEFNFPWDVAIDSNGLVYVADGNGPIQVFTCDGEVVGWIGARGDGPGEMERPSSIAIDGLDQLYVTELHNDRVTVFNNDGEFLYHWCNADKNMRGPCGIALSPDEDHIYISDCWNKCLLVLKL